MDVNPLIFFWFWSIPQTQVFFLESSLQVERSQTEKSLKSQRSNRSGVSRVSRDGRDTKRRVSTGGLQVRCGEEEMR
jgi:hypothetical protein